MIVYCHIDRVGRVSDGFCYFSCSINRDNIESTHARRESALIPVDKVPYRFPTQREPALSAHMHCSRVTVCDGTLIEAISVAASRASREAEAPALRSRLRLLPKQRLRLLRRQL